MPKPAPPGHRRCSMILLGIGGVGKSTLLQECFKWKDAAKQGKTLVVQTFPTDLDFSAKAQEMGLVNQGTRVTCWVTDYVGQNLGTLIRYFVEQQKVIKSPIAYGHINALCIMVDLKHPTDYEYDLKFNGEEELIETARPRPKKGQQSLTPEVVKTPRRPEADPNKGHPDLDRVQQHIRKWNDQALNAVFGLLTAESLRKVFIFVNKLDLMRDHSEEQIEKYKGYFEPLRLKLAERFTGGEVEVLIGSSLRGTAHNAVEQLVFYAADPPTNHVPVA